MKAMPVQRIPDINGPGTAGVILGGSYAVVKTSIAIQRTSGRVLLDGAGALTIVLPAVNDGGDWAGDDNDTLQIVDVSGHAHVIKDAGGNTLATLGGSVGNFADLVAYKGAWIVLSN
jgi:hypothetical protein